MLFKTAAEEHRTLPSSHIPWQRSLSFPPSSYEKVHRHCSRKVSGLSKRWTWTSRMLNGRFRPKDLLILGGWKPWTLVSKQWTSKVTKQWTFKCGRQCRHWQFTPRLTGVYATTETTVRANCNDLAIVRNSWLVLITQLARTHPLIKRSHPGHLRPQCRSIAVPPPYPGRLHAASSSTFPPFPKLPLL